MAAVTPDTNQARAMRVAVKRIEGFAKQFGEAHRNLARHAAFPLVLTPDLLYQIWANFVPETPWTAVAHVLLSRLCRQVGYEMYEMDIADRNLLLRELKEQFGQKRLDELGEFLLDYVAQRLTDNDPDTQDLAQAQEWIALAYTKPNQAVHELAQALSKRVKQEDMTEVFRLTSLIETIAEPLIEYGFEPLLVYADGMATFVRGDLEDATAKLRNLPQWRRLVRIAGVSLPIPEQISGETSQAPEVFPNHGIRINNDIIQKLLVLLRPHLRDENERRAYLLRALGRTVPILDRLIWNSPVDVFIKGMVTELIAFGEITPGKPALRALLEVIRENGGLDKQIEIDELLVELLPVQTPSDLLFDLLLQIDFKQQVWLVKKAMILHRIAAFLVHGEPYCGQQLLVTRLFRLRSNWKNILTIKIDVSHYVGGRTITQLWRQVSSCLGLPKDSEPNEIIERIYARFLTQDVIFIFYTVDYMLPEVLTVWLQEFWEPLVEKAQQNLNLSASETYLLMFLVDNSGSVIQSNIPLAPQLEQPEFPRLPLILPPVSPFPPDVLDDWLDMIKDFADIQIPSGLTSQILLEKSENGIPEFVYEEICSYFGHDWEGGLKKWLI